MQTLLPHEILWLHAANSLAPKDRLEALEDIADMTRISLRELTHEAESMRILAGQGSKWGPSRTMLMPAKDPARGPKPQAVVPPTFISPMKRLMAGR